MTDPRRPSPLDAQWNAAIGRFTGGLSPAALTTAWLDWWIHVTGSPDTQADLVRMAFDPRGPEWPGDDDRFADPAWSAPPYRAHAEAFRRAEAWWTRATTGVSGVEPRHADIVRFAARQWLDMLSPANFALTNPLVARRSREAGGANLVRGLRYWIEDLNRLLLKKPPPRGGFVVGETLATTPGDVVYRNRLIELIRYRPTTAKVRPEPILFVPAWIMKYYILDLTETRSLVRYLRDRGFEVWMISWKNPSVEDAELSMQDYIDLGVRAALTHLHESGAEKIHAAGYCLGGTLLAVAAAAAARDRQDHFATISLLASQLDFSEPGEIGLFINESQVAFMEDMMAVQGYLRADQMAGAFRFLRSQDLIWSRVIRHYLLGERTAMNPLMAWNADATRMPAVMHSEYLRHFYLHNDFAWGRYLVDGRPVAITDIRGPIYAVGTERDHVAPWTSVYRINLLADTDVTFTLSSGGHNGGILSEPGHAGRRFRSRHKTEGAPHLSADDWFAEAKPRDGSWWPHWSAWLKARSGPPVAPRPLGARPLADAPGRYVRMD